MTAQAANKLAIDSLDKMFKELIEKTIPGQASIGNTETFGKKLRIKDIEQLEKLGYKVNKIQYIEDTWLIKW